ncbi:hypothetical protein O6H91_06G138700 [Diphasiastrum complanatum]|uniref:Uncharacterized protein n=1 Tax=Diphasiastrum complanatum TaxID=34168 RepID=A0ACC2DJU8_DIPCM|nr:hypothetical protein O6H91_06G138700 [Diphasiastrum complanatum]
MQLVEAGNLYVNAAMPASEDRSQQRLSSSNGHTSSGYSYLYSDLFNLNPLLSLKLPEDLDDVTSYGSGHDDSNASKGSRRLPIQKQEGKAQLPLAMQSEMTLKRKRVQVEAEAGSYSTCREDPDGNELEDASTSLVSEEHYRSMLGDHLWKSRKTRLKEAIAARSSFAATQQQALRAEEDRSKTKLDLNLLGRLNSKDERMLLSDPQEGPQRVKTNLDSWNKLRVDGSHCLTGKGLDTLAPKNGSLEKLSSGPCILDLGGVKFHIPLHYDQIAPSLNLPDFASIVIDEHVLSSGLKSTGLLSVMTSDPRAKTWSGSVKMNRNFKISQPGDLMLEPYKAYHEHCSDFGGRKFSLQVFDDIFFPSSDSIAESLREGSKGVFSPQQGSPNPLLQMPLEEDQLIHNEVKVLERGDGYEMIQRKVPRKAPAKRDPDVVAKEDSEKVAKIWVNLVRKDLPKHHKAFTAYYKKQLQEAKRASELCQREVKYRNMRIMKMMKAAPMRTRKLARDMVIFWKRVDKEQAEIKKREEKDAAEALKREEEMREARRQQQRLNFLLTQTELYTHFMQNKMAGLPVQPFDSPEQGINPVIKHLEDTNAEGMKSLDVATNSEDAAEEEALKEQALLAATKAVSEQREKTSAFDSECLKLRGAATLDGSLQTAALVDGTKDIDLLHPSTMPITSSVQQPRLFRGSLKEYQLKGLQWLVNCYEQGLNGILADEMGLGKTIQAMAFLAHLAEEKNIWGPFLVVAPASVLNNWADEVNRFCPDLRILPYWGGLQERTILRKNINPKRLYKREAGFHILITSYQLLVSDDKYFRRVKWQYMVLDEAQAIKSANSLRWKTLLSFNCRNRLLLTGTPIQNSMAELWALLHFIMPTLFDSHEQFNEWFSKGIESHAEHGGTLNEHQLNRLHAILKPFMLRRIKKDVITEMTGKREVVISCDLSSRQQAIYQAIKNKISLSDLFDGNGILLNDKKVLNLMNIVVQLRKVCNHPELFERNEGRTCVHFASITHGLSPPPFGELEDIHYAGSHNPICYKVPKLLYQDGMHCLPTSYSGSAQGFLEKWLGGFFNVFSPENVHSSVFAYDQSRECNYSDTFGFTRLMNLSPSEVSSLKKASDLERWLFSLLRADDILLGQIIEQQANNIDSSLSNDSLEDSKTRAVRRMLLLPSRSESAFLRKRLSRGISIVPFEELALPQVEQMLKNTDLLRSVRAYIPSVRAPMVKVACSNRGFAYQQIEEWQNPWMKKLLVGYSRTSEHNGPAVPYISSPVIQECEVKDCLKQPLLGPTFQIFGAGPPLQSFDFAKMLTDSGKLQTLDALLRRLRTENHRVLVFAQMTKMLNILEDYMNYRKYKYLRLDGSSTIMDRRDMVKDFQHRSDIFVFLLSTRAGGLGINLTAADTVIFYESDWNPTMDLQAMDRAHRLGQTKEVTVYRLICKGTVEEKIVKRASQKNTVQQLVMTGGHTQGDVFEADEVVSLLLDDAELEQKMKKQSLNQLDKQQKRKKGWGVSGAGMKGVRLDAEGVASLNEESLSSSGVVNSEDKLGFDTIGKGPSKENGSAKRRSGKKRKEVDEGNPPKPNKLTKSELAQKKSSQALLPIEPSLTKGPNSKVSRSRAKVSNGDTEIVIGESESLLGDDDVPCLPLMMNEGACNNELPSGGASEHPRSNAEASPHGNLETVGLVGALRESSVSARADEGKRFDSEGNGKGRVSKACKTDKTTPSTKPHKLVLKAPGLESTKRDLK